MWASFTSGDTCCTALCCVFTRSGEYVQSDPDLLDALNELRLGRMTERTRCLLSECKRPLPNDGIGATHLFPRNEDVSGVGLHACSMREPSSLRQKAIEHGIYVCSCVLQKPWL
jgi:hypothetical protein